MSYNHEYVLNEDQIAAFLKDAVSRVENASNADIKTFEQIKKLFKKNVPFSRRKYVAALLVKQATQGFRSNRFNRDRNEQRGSFRNDSFQQKNADRRTRDTRQERNADGSEEKPARTPRIQIDPALAKTIFISTGRNRGVSARDLVGLLVSVAELDRMRIGDIRTLANYSFIQLFAEDCEKVIKALDGYSFRGRKLSVSYSRKKGEDESFEGSAPASVSAENTDVSAADDHIPAGVTNDAHADTSVNTEAVKLAEEQNAFAAAQSSAAHEETESAPQFSETSDDGQVKSHFGDGAAY